MSQNQKKKKTKSKNLEETRAPVEILKKEEIPVEILKKEEVSIPVENSENNEIKVEVAPENPLLGVDVSDKNTAFQLLIAFINVAFSRSAYTKEEVEKIIECISLFTV